jgi:CBS domain-containing protein
MKVKDVMTTHPNVCGTDTNLAAATEIMWNGNCGILPVVEDGGYVVGVITDRDICIAVGTRGWLASDLSVRDVISGKVFASLPDNDVLEALETMRKQQVRRLPVVDHEGKIQGILSLDDAATRAQATTSGKKPDLSLEDVALTLKAIAEQPHHAQTAASS